MNAVKPARSRRPRGSLSREQIVAAALRLADGHGLDALTMPSLASELRCGVMSLYGHIADKDDLLDAMAERGLANVRLPRPLPSDPATLLLAWGRALRQTLLIHPCMPLMFLSRPVIAPGIFRGIEALLGRLAPAGMESISALQAVYAIVIYTSGFVAWEVPRTVRQPKASYAAAWRQAFATQPPAELPLVSRVVDDLGNLADPDQFEIGLNALARGLTHT